MKDFPAAHSNDTDWFAVDEDGNLALFNASAEGATPAGMSPDGFDEDWYALSEKAGILVCNWNFSLKKFPEILEPPGKFIPPNKSGRYEIFDDGNFNEYMYDAYLFLIKDPEIIPLIAPGVTVLYFPEIQDAETGLVISPVVSDEKMAANVNRLIQEGEIVGLAGDKERIWCLEIYKNLEVYGYEPENGGFTYPYHRIRDPHHPINIQDLPPGFPLYALKMDVNFEKMKRIQLMEIGYQHEDIYTWNNAGWVALDGKVYDFDGNFLGLEKDL